MAERPSVTCVKFVRIAATLRVGLAQIAGTWHRRVVAVVRIPCRAHFFILVSFSQEGKLSVTGK